MSRGGHSLLRWCLWTAFTADNPVESPGLLPQAFCCSCTSFDSAPVRLAYNVYLESRPQIHTLELTLKTLQLVNNIAIVFLLHIRIIEVTAIGKVGSKTLFHHFAIF